jgi:hypothetical protein
MIATRVIWQIGQILFRSAPIRKAMEIIPGPNYAHFHVALVCKSMFVSHSSKTQASKLRRETHPGSIILLFSFYYPTDKLRHVCDTVQEQRGLLRLFGVSQVFLRMF